MPTLQTKSNTYEEFVEKFTPKKTTDDCYTPPAVYDVVADYVREHYPETRHAQFVRPFYPGGDYEYADYPEGCIVVDNPPFSILARIVNFYLDRGIRFFLFAPHLFLFNYLNRDGVTGVVCCGKVTYDNGANVSTSFLTNLTPDLSFVVAGDLYQRLKNYSRKPTTPKLSLGSNVVSSALLGKMATKGITWSVPSKHTAFTRSVGGHPIFGAGVFLSEAAASQRIQLEMEAEVKKARAAYERTEKVGTVYQPTEEEQAIIRGLG